MTNPLLQPQPAPETASGDLWRGYIDELKEAMASAGVVPGDSRMDRYYQLMEDRREQGIQKYGTPLQVGNGRDFLADAIQEVLDAMIYNIGAEMEGGDPEVLGKVARHLTAAFLLLVDYSDKRGKTE